MCDMNYTELMKDAEFKKSFSDFCKKYYLKKNKQTFIDCYRGRFIDDDECALYMLEDQYRDKI